MSELTKERLEQLRSEYAEIAPQCVGSIDNAEVLALLDALDAMEAQLDEALRHLHEWARRAGRMEAERDEALAEVERLQTDVDAAVDRGYPHDDVVGESWRRLRKDRDEARLAAKALADVAAAYGPTAEAMLAQAYEDPHTLAGWSDDAWDHDGDGEISSNAELEHYASGIHAWKGEEE